MSAWRALSTCAVAAAIGGCAVVVVGMAHTHPKQVAQESPAGPPVPSATVAAPAEPVAPVPSHGRTDPSPPHTAPPVVVHPRARENKPSRHSNPPSPSRPAHTARPTHSAAPAHRAPAPPAPRAAPVQGQALPLGFATGNATRVVTVVAPSTGSTTATLQAWTKAPGGGWLPRGGPILAHVGSQGLTTSPSESKSATPIGSFTLTQAFGAYANPGTALPYQQTNPSDWWISQAGPLYNTFQECAAGCGFTQGSPNEHLYYEQPYYNYAVVIDYNRWPVRQGAGSAFFLHVTDGAPTAGCVSIPQANLVSIMQWLTPAAHPRILIGAG